MSKAPGAGTPSASAGTGSAATGDSPSGSRERILARIRGAVAEAAEFPEVTRDYLDTHTPEDRMVELLAENLADVPELAFEAQDVVRRLEDPIKATGHITILRGNLAPGSAVAKLTGKEGARFEVRRFLNLVS